MKNFESFGCRLSLLEWPTALRLHQVDCKGVSPMVDSRKSYRADNPNPQIQAALDQANEHGKFWEVMQDYHNATPELSLEDDPFPRNDLGPWEERWLESLPARFPEIYVRNSG